MTFSVKIHFIGTKKHRKVISMENEIKERECKTIFDYTERELKRLREKRADELKKNMNEILEYHFKESRIANLDLSSLSDADIKKLIIHAAICHNGDTRKWLQFTGAMQAAMNAISSERGMDFQYKDIFNNCRKTACQHKNTPYTAEEKHKLTEWIGHNRRDIKMLAVDFWLEGGISTKEISEVKKDWLLDSNGKCCSTCPAVLKKNDAHWYLPLSEKRWEIIQEALKIQEEKNFRSEYIFISELENEWKKMPYLSVQKKLSQICKALDIKYQPFKINEAAFWKIE